MTCVTPVFCWSIGNNESGDPSVAVKVWTYCTNLGVASFAIRDDVVPGAGTARTARSSKKARAKFDERIIFDQMLENFAGTSWSI